MSIHTITKTILLTLVSVVSMASIGTCLAQTDTLKKNKDYQSGIEALADHLGDIAILKFQSALTIDKLKIEDKQALLLLIAETQILNNNYSSALKTLEDPTLSTSNLKHYWMGQAKISLGNFSEAENDLKAVAKSNELYHHARIALANIYILTNRIEDALKLLNELGVSKTTLANRATLTAAELLLINEQPEKSKQTLAELPADNELTPFELKKKQLILSNILIKQQNYEQAIRSLTTLIQSKQHLSFSKYQLATISLADAQHLNNQTNEALITLSRFLSENESIEHVDALFSRIDLWLPNDAKITDSIIEKLMFWAGRTDTNSDLAPIISKSLKANSHLQYAKFLARSSEPTLSNLAVAEFEAILENYPDHPIAGKALAELAAIQLRQDQAKEAILTLQKIQTTNSPVSLLLKQKSAFLEGQLATKNNDYEAAAVAYQKAWSEENNRLNDAAAFNTALAHLAADNTQGFNDAYKTAKSEKLQQDLTLERLLWSASKKNISARLPLHEAILKNPDHSRINQAKLTLARNSIRVAPSDNQLCEAMLKSIDLSSLNAGEHAEHSYISYLSASANGNYPQAVSIASQLIEKNLNSTRREEFELLLGQAYFRNGQHNIARLKLTQLANKSEDSRLSQFAIYYAALAARLEGTPQSLDESIELFQQIISKDSVTKNEATLQLADIYNTSNQPEKSYKLLSKIYQAKASSNFQRNVAISLSESLQAMGKLDDKYYLAAIQVYDQLLAQKNLPTLWFNRIHYHKAYIYDKLKNHQEAINTYYAVITQEKPTNVSQEWTWYYRCGFNAIAMLEKLGNPKAAITIAKKLAATNGPRADEANKKARSLEMKHMIWSP